MKWLLLNTFFVAAGRFTDRGGWRYPLWEGWGDPAGTCLRNPGNKHHPGACWGCLCTGCCPSALQGCNRNDLPSITKQIMPSASGQRPGAISENLRFCDCSQTHLPWNLNLESHEWCLHRLWVFQNAMKQIGVVNVKRVCVKCNRLSLLFERMNAALWKGSTWWNVQVDLLSRSQISKCQSFEFTISLFLWAKGNCCCCNL